MSKDRNESEKLKRDGLYQLADRIPYEKSEAILRQCGFLNGGGDLATSKDNYLRDHIRAQPTGEYRPPKAGEWYLSGSAILAYRAGGALSSSYHIARLVHVKSETKVTHHVIAL